MKSASHSKVLITGSRGFTGQHISYSLRARGYKVVGLNSDLTHKSQVQAEVLSIEPDYVIHLAAMSFAAEEDVEAIYNVNVVGSTNLLEALSELEKSPKKVILASSATVYGNTQKATIAEDDVPKPISHYGCSKLAMEHMAQNFFHSYPILIVRPFNYTGIGHSERFLIPKIIRAYKDQAPSIELGNLDVFREFNDVRDISNLYIDLMESESCSETTNLCSGRVVSLLEIIENMNEIAGYDITVNVNPKFVRPNEIQKLSGSLERLSSVVTPRFKYDIFDTLKWMFQSEN